MWKANTNSQCEGTDAERAAERDIAKAGAIQLVRIGEIVKTNILDNAHDRLLSRRPAEASVYGPQCDLASHRPGRSVASSTGRKREDGVGGCGNSAPEIIRE